MPGLMPEPLTAVVCNLDRGPRQAEPPNDWMRHDLRLLKAALLYADRVTLQELSLGAGLRVWARAAPDPRRFLQLARAFEVALEKSRG